MKIKTEHYALMASAIKALGKDTILAHSEGLKFDKRVKDHAMRLRWDCLWMCKIGHWVSDTLCPYLDDVHIDTALRRIMKEVLG